MKDSLKKLTGIREQLETHRLDGFVVPASDEYQGEYVPGCARRLLWLTGFTGSAGIAVALKNKAAFFTDGRYTLQAGRQVDRSCYEIHNIADMQPDVWIEKNVQGKARIGMDARLHVKSQWERYMKKFRVIAVANLVDAIWRDRPAAPQAEAKIHGIRFAGESSKSKRNRITEILKEKKAEAVILTAPDSICWLLNIRGNDVPHTPFVLCAALLQANGKMRLFVDPEKINSKVKTHLGKDVTVVPEKNLSGVLAKLKGKKILIDPDSASAWFFDELEKAKAVIVKGQDPCQLPKAIKNSAEMEGMRQAHIRDGAAMVRFFFWLEKTLQGGKKVTEISAAEALERFRRKNPLFRDLSFDTISGYGANGAIVHYRATPETSKAIKPGSLYLLDSGAQYDDGTTDITRTIAIGKPSVKQKEHFTRVLKGHIAIAQARFPEGTTGAQLDTLARYHLWQAGLDYDHGTGHGVGSYLSVHEGPQRISKQGGGVALKPGMVLSNEPGCYIDGQYGIRIENLVLVKPGAIKKYLEFETLTKAPLDLKLVDVGLMTESELEWLNRYHREVAKVLAPYLSALEIRWLKKATAPILK